MNSLKQDALFKLSQLDLQLYPVQEVHELINELGQYAVLTTTLHEGSTIIRVRSNFNGEVFTTVDELSYKKPENNTKFQRASTPQRTMFYGTVEPDNEFPRNNNFERFVGLTEACPLLRSKNITDGEQVVTFGKWRVLQDIRLISIIHHENYIGSHQLTQKLNIEYADFLTSQSKDMQEDSKAISKFFANEFAKEIQDEQSDHEYLLSAIYTERLSSLMAYKGINKSGQSVPIAGVLYPSVRAEGRGFNVAFTPEYADHALRLEKVLECTVYKKGSRVIIDNNKAASVQPGGNEFNLKSINEPRYHRGKEEIYRLLNEQPYSLS